MKAFSLVELLIAIAVLAIIVGVGVPALRNSNTDAIEVAQDATAKLLNEGIARARLEGDENPVLDGNNIGALADYLYANNYITFASGNN